MRKGNVCESIRMSETNTQKSIEIQLPTPKIFTAHTLHRDPPRAFKHDLDTLDQL